jgi:hypothetical protein
MVITPSRAYINRTITWLFQWCRRPIRLSKSAANGVIQMKRNLVALAVAALLTGMVATDAPAAGHGGFGGGHMGVKQ